MNQMESGQHGECGMRGSEKSKDGCEADLVFVDGKERISKLVETVTWLANRV